MRAKQAKAIETRPVNLRMRDETRTLIDRAARIRGKNRSEFMIEASLLAAQEALLDQTLVHVDAATYRHYIDVLDEPPTSKGFDRLMSVSPPWAK